MSSHLFFFLSLVLCLPIKWEVSSKLIRSQGQSFRPEANTSSLCLCPNQFRKSLVEFWVTLRQWTNLHLHFAPQFQTESSKTVQQFFGIGTDVNLEGCKEITYSIKRNNLTELTNPYPIHSIPCETPCWPYHQRDNSAASWGRQHQVMNSLFCYIPNLCT